MGKPDDSTENLLREILEDFNTILLEDDALLEEVLEVLNKGLGMHPLSTLSDRNLTLEELKKMFREGILYPDRPRRPVVQLDLDFLED